MRTVRGRWLVLHSWWPDLSRRIRSLRLARGLSQSNARAERTHPRHPYARRPTAPHARDVGRSKRAEVATRHSRIRADSGYSSAPRNCLVLAASAHMSLAPRESRKPTLLRFSHPRSTKTRLALLATLDPNGVRRVRRNNTRKTPTATSVCVLSRHHSRKPASMRCARCRRRFAGHATAVTGARRNHRGDKTLGARLPACGPRVRPAVSTVCSHPQKKRLERIMNANEV